jgi:hypothetical protein
MVGQGFGQPTVVGNDVTQVAGGHRDVCQAHVVGLDRRLGKRFRLSFSPPDNIRAMGIPGPPGRSGGGSGSGSGWFWWLLAAAAGMVLFGMYSYKKRIYICFDYDNDKHYRYLLSALEANASNSLEFIDVTPSEIQSSDIGRIKAALGQKIKDATHTLVIVGAHANDSHKDSVAIGSRNWQWWEIEKSKEEGKGLIAVKIERGYEPPGPLTSAGAKWAMDFNVPAILKAISET